MSRQAQGARRILTDIRNRRHLEAYALFLIALAVAVLNLLGITSDRVANSILLAGIAFVIYRIIGPSSQSSVTLDSVLLDRNDYQSFSSFAQGASDLSIYAPIAVNSIPRWAGDITENLLARGGRARIVVLDPTSPGMVPWPIMLLWLVATH
jgi:hypothetical protein